MRATLFDAGAVENLIDSAARDLTAATRGYDASAEMQASVIRIARTLRDDLIKMLSQVRDTFAAEQQRLDRQSQDIAGTRDRLRAEQFYVAEDRKRLDDEMLQQFIAKSDASIESERWRLAEEKSRLADERRALDEERRHMALVDTGVGVERMQLAEEARDLASERQHLVEEWRHHWLKLAHTNCQLAQGVAVKEVQALADERRWLHIERSRLAEEAHQLSMRSRQLDEERQYLALEFSFQGHHRRGVEMEWLQLAKDRRLTPSYHSAPLGMMEDAGPLLFEARRQSFPKVCGRLDELHEQAQALALM